MITSLPATPSTPPTVSPRDKRISETMESIILKTNGTADCAATPKDWIGRIISPNEAAQKESNEEDNVPLQNVYPTLQEEKPEEGAE